MSVRAERLIAELDGAGVDLVLVTDLVNVRYLTGYTGTNGLVLVGPQTRVFVTDFRYVEQAAEEVGPSYEQVRGIQDLVNAVPELLPEGRLRLGFEDGHTSVRAHARLRALMPDRAQLVPSGDLVEQLRTVKEAQEIELMSRAAQIADEALEALLTEGLQGRTERELALTLEHELRLRGAEDPAFPSIIAAGPHGALPHAQPRDVPVSAGQLVVIDWGARYGGYDSDCTRTVAVGPVDDEAREAYEVVLRAQLAGLEAVRVGGSGREIDAEVREIIAGAGYGEHYGHGLGHGVGLEIHEAPTLGQRSTDTLRSGTVVTVEPGVYLPGRFGIRIEDLVVVEERGNRILTGLPKELRIVD